MPDASARSRLLPLFVLLATPCLAGTARAELPEPSDFSVAWHVTDEAGERVRAMTERDHQQFLNRARCECGQQVGADIRMTRQPADLAQRLWALIGRECAVAETALAGEHRRCGQLAVELVAAYVSGIPGAFHPAFLAHGVVPTTLTRRTDDPDALLAGGCDGAGDAGLWMCNPNANAHANCQQEEFFIAPDDALSRLSSIAPLAFDYEPPLSQPTDLSVEPGNGAVLLRWELSSAGDIAGFRVLCEEADGGAARATRSRRPTSPPSTTAPTTSPPATCATTSRSRPSTSRSLRSPTRTPAATACSRPARPATTAPTTTPRACATGIAGSVSAPASTPSRGTTSAALTSTSATTRSSSAA
ncbi:hypothetical protein [Nannocystis pusilla]|uniref:hypothetical protein n=1 Tax=Nannocystis pusilla TaxID=889268 RepID=UPI003B7A3672